MNRHRWLLMLAAPAPIVASSMALTKWFDAPEAQPLASNEILERHSSEPAAQYPVSQVPASDEKLAAACAARGKVMKEQLGDECAVLVQSPFVIAGDLTAAQLKSWHERTIAPAADAMGQRYFKTKPSQPITVLLFRSKESYEHFADKLFRDRGISVYGYYKPRERTLVMNIATGGGTLVHELTHALVDFDCPKVPTWFNEGLASLHEQCRFSEDRRGPYVEGLVNWRLPRLQEEIKAGRLPSLEALLRDDDFRGAREGINYAQARYFCLYLQRKGVLEDYYAKLKANIAEDPQGLRAVKQVFPKHSWEQLDKEYLDFVGKLQPGDS